MIVASNWEAFEVGISDTDVARLLLGFILPVVIDDQPVLSVVVSKKVVLASQTRILAARLTAETEEENDCGDTGQECEKSIEFFQSDPFR